MLFPNDIEVYPYVYVFAPITIQLQLFEPIIFVFAPKHVLLYPLIFDCPALYPITVL